jgi:hypothetical protein
MVVVVGRLNTKAGQVAEKFGKALRDQQSCGRGYVGVEFPGPNGHAPCQTRLDRPVIER